jgi:hypothetical protein
VATPSYGSGGLGLSRTGAYEASKALIPADSEYVRSQQFGGDSDGDFYVSRSLAARYQFVNGGNDDLYAWPSDQPGSFTVTYDLELGSTGKIRYIMIGLGHFPNYAR